VRTAVFLALAVAGCAHAAAPTVTPRQRATGSRAGEPANAPSDAEVRRLSHEVLDAYDRGDVAALASSLGSSFLHFEDGAVTDRQTELDRLAKRRKDAPRIGKRSWSNEHVRVGPGTAVFIGEAVEQMAGSERYGAREYDGWYTLTWSQEAGAWKLSLWSWQKGGAAAARDTWNDIYRQARGFNQEPNRLLVDAVQTMRPGAALDVAMGQGRNALYLASRGFQVTGVDFSDEGVRRARDGAAMRKLPLEAVNADIDAYDFGVARWDLVTMIYANANVKWVERIRPSLKTGALFVLEDFHAEGPGGSGFATGQLASLFADGFAILRDEVVDDAPDWSMDRAKLVRFVAKKR